MSALPAALLRVAEDRTHLTRLRAYQRLRAAAHRRSPTVGRAELEWDGEDYTDVEAIIIAEFLKDNKELTRLDLARNSIADAGARALAAALRENTKLEYLNLESNVVAEKGEHAPSPWPPLPAPPAVAFAVARCLLRAAVVLSPRWPLTCCGRSHTASRRSLDGGRLACPSWCGLAVAHLLLRACPQAARRCARLSR